MGATNSADVESYLYLLGTSLAELSAVVGHLTIPETYFFRIPDHFRVFQEVVLPERIRARQAARRLSILCAGCASGEEPYTLAMLLQGKVELAGWQVAIRGIDVNAAAIAKGKNGRYSAWSLREIEAGYQGALFSSARDASFQLSDSIREMVSLEEGNLADAQAPFWKPRAYDVIFFRNAFMYFSAEAGQAVVARMAESLAPGGYLFMGPAETLRGVSQDFRSVPHPWNVLLSAPDRPQPGCKRSARTCGCHATELRGRAASGVGHVAPRIPGRLGRHHPAGYGAHKNADRPSVRAIRMRAHTRRRSPHSCADQAKGHARRFESGAGSCSRRNVLSKR